MAQGGDIRGDNRETSAWLQRLQGKMAPDRGGLASPMQQPGISGGGLQGNMGRGAYSPIMSSNWQSSLGLAPAAAYDGGARGGNSRVNTGRSAGIYQGKSDLESKDNVQTYSKDGSVSYGGNRNTFNFAYGDQDAQQIAESGNIGLYAKDRSGQALSVNPMNNLSEQQQWDKQTDMSGKGYSTEQGFYNASLDNPSDKIIFNNNINQSLVGKGSTQSLSQGASDQDTDSQVLENKSKATPILSSLPLIGDMFKGHSRKTRDIYNVDTNAQQGMVSSGNLNAPGSAEYGIQAGAGMYNSMDTGAGLIPLIESSADIQGRQGGRLQMQRGGQGYLIQSNAGDALGGALLEDKQSSNKRILGREHNERNIAGGASDLSANADVSTQVGVRGRGSITNNPVAQDWIDKNINKDIINNFDSYKSRYPGLYSRYADANDMIQKQYAIANPQASASYDNSVEATARAAANGVSSAVQANAGLSGNIAASGGVSGDLAAKASAAANQQGGFISNPYGGVSSYLGSHSQSESGKIELTGDIKSDKAVLQSVTDIAGALAGGGANAIQVKQELSSMVEDISSKLPANEYGDVLLQKLKDSPELAVLFSMNGTPEAIANSIINYSAEKHDTGYNVGNHNFVAYIKTGEAGSGNINAQTSLEAQRKRAITREVDPTPDKPNSGDEIVYANIGRLDANGQPIVKAMPKGQFITQGITQTFNTDISDNDRNWASNDITARPAQQVAAEQAKYQQDLAAYNQTLNHYRSYYGPYKGQYMMTLHGMPAPVAPSAVTYSPTSYDTTPVQQQNQLNYDQMYYVNGADEGYNALANATMDRYYDDNSDRDYSNMQGYIDAANAGLASSQDGMYNGYKAAEWQAMIDRYNMETQYDTSGVDNRFRQSSNTQAYY